ncbi:amidohydrolase family protein [Nocardiopsis protaetiae]|uniref:amidohydrolase family protein n=1 Tax=Nocardiopsis protaetiae TaxID=3382270 RepID=UPI00387ACD91
MKIITLEEHYADPAITAATPVPPGAGNVHSRGDLDPSVELSYLPDPARLLDLGEGRIADMDANGISMQILSSLTTTQLPPEVAVDLVRATNDTLAAAVRRHPDRFAGFAALPTTVPEAAADELSRGVEELGFVGTLIMGRTGGDFLSAPRFEPILARAAALGVPLYLHPGVPPLATREENYGGLDPLVSTRFGTTAWGWHSETGVHFVHLVLSGVLDRYPDLQIILGHWGEMVPFFIERIDEALPRAATGLERTFGEYMRQNVYVTPSGMFTQANLRYCVDMLGVDRIMYSVDYPFVGNEGAAAFLEKSDLSPQDRERIAHGTAEKLFGL